MSIKTLEQKKQQQTLLIIGIGILIIAGVVLYFGFWKQAPVAQEPEPDRVTNVILEEKLKKIDLDFNFLTETILPFLKSHGELPVNVGETGRSNPFISY